MPESGATLAYAFQAAQTMEVELERGMEARHKSTLEKAKTAFERSVDEDQ